LINKKFLWRDKGYIVRLKPYFGIEAARTMKLHDLITRFLRYNLWANERLTAWLLTLDRDLLYERTGSSFGTVDRTLQHILAGQIYWYSITVKGKILEFDRPITVNAVDEVASELVSSSRQLLDSLSALSEDQLLEQIQASDSKQSRYEYILHLVNHGSYHRGQVVTMCRALGITVEIPVTDYDGYLWWIENMEK
jgi:uncharacterized damage-inducible protein DinB